MLADHIISPATPITLPCGAHVRNRLIKSAMSESMADPYGVPTDRLMRLYDFWGRSKAGILFTGNVQVDDCHLEEAGNMRIEQYWTNKAMQEKYNELADAAQNNGCQCWVQLSHAGRNSDQKVNLAPLSPSNRRVKGRKYARSGPVPMTKEDVNDVVKKFGRAAAAVKDAGFSGVEIHAAHGYLLSSFISPLVNDRDDEYGGSLENRARFLMEVYEAVRKEVDKRFPIAVKLNSQDFQKGGSTVQEAVQIAKWLEERGVDVVEISGGNMETMAMLGLNAEALKSCSKSKSTREREAYFLEYAEVISRTLTTAKVMVSGGFRKKSTMQYALRNAGVDLIGLGRPFLYTQDPAALIIDGATDCLPSFETDEAMITWQHKPMTLFVNKHKLMTCVAMMAAANMLRVADGLDFVDNPAQIGTVDFCKYVFLHSASARRLKGPKCTGTVYSDKGTSQSTMRMALSFVHQNYFH